MLFSAVWIKNRAADLFYSGLTFNLFLKSLTALLISCS